MPNKSSATTHHIPTPNNSTDATIVGYRHALVTNLTPPLRAKNCYYKQNGLWRIVAITSAVTATPIIQPT
jgi:hypothetical protein